MNQYPNDPESMDSDTEMVRLLASMPLRKPSATLNARVGAAVSSREELQTLVELQAEAQGFEAQNTLELSTRLRQILTYRKSS